MEAWRRRTTDRRPISEPWRRDLKILLLGYTHIANALGKGKPQTGKMDAILTDPQLDSRI